jgi:diguanylate cyclase (GGDEF)-like protein
MLDVDHFKSFNDAYGHEAGDLILKSLADCLRDGVRSEDLVCRYGGEEFVIILPEITEELAVLRAEAVRDAVTHIEMLFRGEPLRQISISVGVAMYPNPAKSAIELLRLADRGLYQAKDAGRNQVKMLTA